MAPARRWTLPGLAFPGYCKTWSRHDVLTAPRHLSPDVDWKGKCPKCGSALHCCKQCAHFEPSTRFQCLKPIPVRIPVKDQANDCALFAPRVTVARDAAPMNNNHHSTPVQQAPRSPNDARAAFDNLFKKPE